MEKVYYERNLPHLQPIGGTFFITYRLYGSIPIEVLTRLKEEANFEVEKVRKICKGEELEMALYEIQRKCFGKYDKYLDNNPNQPHWLRSDNICRIVANSLHNCAERYFHLHTFCIMPNHVHLLMTQFDHAPMLWKIMQVHKGFTARQANALLERQGSFWMPESYDHLVRKNGEFERILRYILMNPVKAGFVEKWSDWEWSFVAPELM